MLRAWALTNGFCSAEWPERRDGARTPQLRNMSARPRFPNVSPNACRTGKPHAIVIVFEDASPYPSWPRFLPAIGRPTTRKGIHMTGFQFAVPTMAGLLLGATLAFGPTATQAEDSAAIVHERQQLMKDFGSAMKTIGGYLQAGMGTTEDVAAAAGVIAEGAGKLPDLFPAGTSMDDVMDPETGAKPVIWEQWDGFVADADTLEARATTLQELAMAMNDDALGGAFEALGNDGCGSCHKTFREKLD